MNDDTEEILPDTQPKANGCCPPHVVGAAPPMLPECPAGNGTYTLRCVKDATGCVLSWVAV